MPDALMLSDVFRDRVRATWPEESAAWLAALPALLEAARERWSLTDPRTHEPLSFQYVEYVSGPAGEQFVLKVAVPDEEWDSQVEALLELSGRGGVGVVDEDRAAGLLLMQRAIPGEQLTSAGDDDEQTRIAAGVMRGLHRPLTRPGTPFATVEDWFARAFEKYRAAFGADGPFEREMLAEAEAEAEALCATQGERVLLHGDLHHENILRSGERWVVIDPHGVVGEREYECCAILRNPRGFHAWPDMRERCERRLDILSEELGFERERIRRWAFVQAVLSGLWSTEGGGDPSAAIRLAEAFR